MSRPVRLWRPGGWALLALVFAFGTHGASTAENTPAVKAHELKAAYVYNFTKLTAWPADKFSDATSPLVIGVWGSDSVAAALTALVRGRSANGHPVEVLSVADGSASGLHVLYVDASQRKALDAKPAILSAAGVLTVSDAPDFMARGGMIRLLVESDRLQFEINAVSAERAGLSMSSQLLMLATSVRRQEVGAAAP